MYEKLHQIIILIYGPHCHSTSVWRTISAIVSCLTDETETFSVHFSLKSSSNKLNSCSPFRLTLFSTLPRTDNKIRIKKLFVFKKFRVSSFFSLIENLLQTFFYFGSKKLKQLWPPVSAFISRLSLEYPTTTDNSLWICHRFILSLCHCTFRQLVGKHAHTRRCTKRAFRSVFGSECNS